jgi:hypothetical protein
MKYLVYIGVFLVLLSCSKVNKPPKPENLISKDKMVAILVDLTIFNSAKGTNKIVIEKNGITIQNYIYERHKVDSVQFKKSSDYYTYDVKAYTDIYKRVEDSLSKLKDKYIEEKENKIEEKQTRDSLKIEQKRRMIPKKFNDSVLPKTEGLPEIF